MAEDKSVFQCSAGNIARFIFQHKRGLLLLMLSLFLIGCSDVCQQEHASQVLELTPSALTLCSVHGTTFLYVEPYNKTAFCYSASPLRVVSYEIS